jgi:tetratricopeptide (TPR) repeat protein
VSDEIRDVFISYAHADSDWVRVLAENLNQAGLQVFYDEWDIAPGDVLVHKLDEGIRSSRNGILIVSPASLSRPYVQEEYAAMMTRAIAGKQRLIPALLKDAEMPPFMASRVYVDFRNADGPSYLARLDQLIRALKGQPAGPPPKLPPRDAYMIAGPRLCRLSISKDRVAFSIDETELAGAPPHPDLDIGDLNWRLKRARGDLGPVRDTTGTASRFAELERTLEAVGTELATAFLPTEVKTALEGVVAEAERLNSSVQLALDTTDPLADLPWETLRLPHTGPLALHSRVEVFRRIDSGGPAPAIVIPGPLRILVAIGSPEAQNARGELLDMEAELQRILDAVDKPRRAGKAFVNILEQGTVAAINSALAERRYHVLHISCHAGPNTLILETADGKEDRVTAQRLWEEAIPAGRAPALVVLSGCATGQDTISSESDDGRLPGLARTLVRRGIPAVIAMQAPVSDRYATELMSSVYEALSTSEEPKPLAALGEARRRLERQRIASPQQQSPELGTPALFCAATPALLYDPKQPPEQLSEAPEPALDPGVVVRRIGDMVGRRREQRLILHALRDPTQTGVVIHGIGGVGKSTLAAQILHRLADDDDFVLISIKGETDPDRVLGAIGIRLLSIALAESDDEAHPLRRLAGVLREPKYPWRERFEILAQNFLNSTRVAFFFDNFEDNLKEGAPPEELAALSARWLQAPGASRLVFTCRYPFKLPDDAQDGLQAFHLGPLSWAETRKLLWRLEGLRSLSPKDQRRAYEQVGGHPRVLEYLDAILRGGKARFPDVQARLGRQLAKKGIRDPARWCADTAGGFDAALAETVTLAADDVLLDQLLAQLEDAPLARRLLISAAVYRVPVDEVGLVWMVGEPAEQVPDPARTARLEEAQERLREAQKANPLAGVSDIAHSHEETQQWLRDLAEERRPPVEAPEGFAAAKQQLLDLSLLAPVRFADTDEDKFLVHRWTAGALEGRSSEAEQREAHHRAAAYWQWSVAKLPQSRQSDIEDLLEARHHLRAIGDLPQFYEVSDAIIVQLDVWGALEWEERLIRETLSLMPEGSREASRCLLGLGVVAQRRGDYDAALDCYRDSLAIDERLGNLVGMASCYNNLGIVAQKRGDYDAALDWCRKSLAIEKQLGNLEGIATSYNNLGIVAQKRGDYDAALNWYRKSLAINEQLSNLGGMARSYGELGNTAYLRDDYGAAIDWYKKAQMVFEQLGDRAGMASSYHQLGTVAQQHGDYDAALDWYRKSLAIEEQLGNRTGMASTLGNMGALYTEMGRAADAMPFTVRSFFLGPDMETPEAAIDLLWLSRQRSMLGPEAFSVILTNHLDSERVRSTLLAILDKIDAKQKGTEPVRLSAGAPAHRRRGLAATFGKVFQRRSRPAK